MYASIIFFFKKFRGDGILCDLQVTFTYTFRRNRPCMRNSDKSFASPKKTYTNTANKLIILWKLNFLLLFQTDFPTILGLKIADTLFFYDRKMVPSKKFFVELLINISISLPHNRLYRSQKTPDWTGCQGLSSYQFRWTRLLLLRMWFFFFLAEKTVFLSWSMTFDRDIYICHYMVVIIAYILFPSLNTERRLFTSHKNVSCGVHYIVRRINTPTESRQAVEKIYKIYRYHWQLYKLPIVRHKSSVYIYLYLYFSHS